jgi:hypothetical protein
LARPGQNTTRLAEWSSDAIAQRVQDHQEEASAVVCDDRIIPPHAFDSLFSAMASLRAAYSMRTVAANAAEQLRVAHGLNLTLEIRTYVLYTVFAFQNAKLRCHSAGT